MTNAPRPRLPRNLGLLMAVLVLAVVYVGITRGFDPVFDALQAMEQLARTRPVATAAAFLVLYAAGATATLPIGSLMCLTAGYLFGFAAGSVLALAGGLGGAVLTFALVRHLAGDRWRQRILNSRGAGLMRILEEHVFYYLVVLRTIPVAPFFLVNAAAAFTAVTTPRYTLATLIGLVPTSLIFAAIGAGLGSLIEAREMAGPGLLLDARFLLPLLALATLIALTAWTRRIIERRADRQREPAEAAGSSPRRSKMTPPSDSSQGSPSRERK